MSYNRHAIQQGLGNIEHTLHKKVQDIKYP